ncbi:glycosyltransferase [Desulfuribacillus alkaliarsenatis]|nr:glycosyltransferase [Desulfuribacillus alkaliarsenatis]
MDKKVLIVSYLFPPIGGGGVQRALKMAKYLEQYGWEAHILTVTEDVYFASKDASLLNQLPPSVKIHRANHLDLIGKFTGQATKNNQTTTNKVSMKARVKQLIKPFLKALKSRILIPDEQILWRNNAVKLGKEVIKSQNIQAIFSTSGPNTNHLVAYELKKHMDLPWIADFRDPWTDNMHRSGIWWREKLEARLERKVVTSADVIMTVTESFLDGFINKYGSTAIKRGSVVHNGYDIADYNNLNHTVNNTDDNGVDISVDSPVDKPVDNPVHKPVDASVNREVSTAPVDKLKLVYTGIFYDKRNPRLLLRAIRELINEGRIDQQKIALHFAGIFDYPGQSANWQTVIDTELEEQIILHGQLPHGQALNLLASADVQLLIADSDKTAGAYIPGKLFEYIAIGKPIFALSHQGESTEIIESLGNGIVADPTSLHEIKKSLSVLYRNWLNTGIAIDMPGDILEKTKKYQRHEQARMLAEELDILHKKN